MNHIINTQTKKQARERRVRAHLRENLERPRLHVYRSNKHTYAQIIDDKQGKTIASACDVQVKAKGKTKSELASAIGTLVAQKSLELKVVKVKFDRGSRRFHGRVKAVAMAARAAGLDF